MKSELLKKIINLEGFILENQVAVDGKMVYIRPLYIEWLSLFPTIQIELANDITKQIQIYNPSVIFAIEASILPLASLIAQNLNVPLSIVRKPRNYKHEKDEPTIFIKDELKNLSSVLLDDAIWSGYTMSHIIQEFEQQKIKLPHCYFVFDFYNFCEGGTHFTEQQHLFIQKRDSWVSYQEIVEIAHKERLISDLAYYNTIKLFST